MITGRGIAEAGSGLKAKLQSLYKDDQILMSYKRLEVSVGLGWHPIVFRVAEQLAGKGVAFTQIKEKFGGLRIYTENLSDTITDDEIWKIIGKAEDVASATCEHCGEPGEAREGSWVKTLCDTCSDNAPKLLYRTGTGQKIRTHRLGEDCHTYGCVIHNPTNHCMKDFPTHWRTDRGIMERICPHGIGHPDPDSVSFWYRTKGEDAKWDTVHGCDGCCSGRVGSPSQ